MRVLVTGAFGNIGSHTVDALVDAGHEVRALRFGGERVAKARMARWQRGRVQVVDGDVRDPATLPAAVRDVDVIVHCAFVIPPACLEAPEAARRVNVDGTKNLLAAAAEHAPRARFHFASTLDVFGRTAHLPPPRRVTDATSATDVYAEHKLECEALVRASGLTWGIVRYADVPPLMLRGPVPIMFEIPLAQRIEVIHPIEAGLATARAATSDVTWGHVWLVGGGARCQVTYGTYLARMFAAMELGDPLPERAFTTTPYCTDWLDTEASERAFRYQSRSFEDVVRDIAALLGWRRPFARLARPLVRRHMLRLSPYWKLPEGASRERRVEKRTI
jgi:nucleoside-diphosphate-sugar epimerase